MSRQPRDFTTEDIILSQPKEVMQMTRFEPAAASRRLGNDDGCEKCCDACAPLGNIICFPFYLLGKCDTVGNK